MSAFEGCPANGNDITAESFQPNCCYNESDCRHCRQNPPTNLTRHRFSERGFYHCGEPGLILCGFCHKLFVCNDCAKNKRKNNICEIETCLMALSCRLESERHSEVTHCQERRYRCSICLHPFKEATALARHLSYSRCCVPIGPLEEHMTPADEESQHCNAANRLVIGVGEFLNCFVCFEKFDATADFKEHLMLKHLKLSDEERKMLLQRKYHVGESTLREIIATANSDCDFYSKLSYCLCDVMLGFTTATEMRMETAGNKLRYCFAEVVNKLTKRCQRMTAPNLNRLLQVARAVLKEFEVDFANVWQQNQSLPCTASAAESLKKRNGVLQNRLAAARKRLTYCSCRMDSVIQENDSSPGTSRTACAHDDVMTCDNPKRGTCPDAAAIATAFSEYSVATLEEARTFIRDRLVNTVLSFSSIRHKGRTHADEQLVQLHKRLLETMCKHLSQISQWRVEALVSCADKTVASCDQQISSLWHALRKMPMRAVDMPSVAHSAVVAERLVEATSSSPAPAKRAKKRSARSVAAASNSPQPAAKAKSESSSIDLPDADSRILLPFMDPPSQRTVRCVGLLECLHKNAQALLSHLKNFTAPPPLWGNVKLREEGLCVNAEKVRATASELVANWTDIFQGEWRGWSESSFGQALQLLQAIPCEPRGLGRVAGACKDELVKILRTHMHTHAVETAQAAAELVDAVPSLWKHSVHAINQACLDWLRKLPPSRQCLPDPNLATEASQAGSGESEGSASVHKTCYLVLSMQISSNLERMFHNLHETLTARVCDGKGIFDTSPRGPGIVVLEKKLNDGIMHRLRPRGLNLPTLFADRRGEVEEAVRHSMRTHEIDLRRIWQLCKLEETSKVKFF